MQDGGIHNPSVTVALALVAGTLAQALGRQLGMPSIVLLLIAGVLLGPEFADAIRPAVLGDGLFILVGFAVAVILFEGGMNLQLSRIRRENLAIRRLVSVGAVVTALGATLAARLLLHWEWALCGLFGSLMIVTGPTVVGPLLRRLRVEHATSTILEAEGVFIDAIGAIAATVALDIALSPSSEDMAAAVIHGAQGLLLGSLIGGAAGFSLGYLLRVRRLIPEGLENVLALSCVLALFHVSNAFVPESGVAAVTIAGVVVGNIHSHVRKGLHAFKEELTALLIGMLFVLLAADVKLDDVRALGMPGLYVVAALILIVRPLNVLAGTYGSGLPWRKKLFLSWIGPRGIVAAAIASLFAVELESHGVDGGPQLRALVFLVIGITVLFSGLTGGLVSRLLGLRRAMDEGWVILGANELARHVGKALVAWGQEVVLLDTNPHHCSAAEQDGLKAIHANGLEPRTLQRASIDTRAGAIGLSTNSRVNLDFANKAKTEGKLTRRYAGVGRSRATYNLSEAESQDVRIMFGRPADLEHWVLRLRRGHAEGAVVQWDGRTSDGAATAAFDALPRGVALPVLHMRGSKVRPVGADITLRLDDQVRLLIDRDRRAEVEQALADTGFTFVELPT